MGLVGSVMGSFLGPVIPNQESEWDTTFWKGSVSVRGRPWSLSFISFTVNLLLDLGRITKILYPSSSASRVPFSGIIFIPQLRHWRAWLRPEVSGYPSPHHLQLPVTQGGWQQGGETRSWKKPCSLETIWEGTKWKTIHLLTAPLPRDKSLSTFMARILSPACFTSPQTGNLLFEHNTQEHFQSHAFYKCNKHFKIFFLMKRKSKTSNHYCWPDPPGSADWWCPLKRRCCHLQEEGYKYCDDILRGRLRC